MTRQERPRRIRHVGAALTIAVAGGVALFENQPVRAASLVVDTASEVFDSTSGDPAGPDGFMSLADAIHLANVDPDLDTITFAITDPASGAGPHTINVGNAPPKITEDLVITGPGTEQLRLTNTVGNVFVIDNDADFTVTDVSLRSPTTAVPARADGIVVDDGGVTTIRNVDIDIVAKGIRVEDLGVGVDSVIIENVEVDDASDQGVQIGDVEVLDVDELTVKNADVGLAAKGVAAADIDGLVATGVSHGLVAENVVMLAVANADITAATNTAISVKDPGPTTISAAAVTDGAAGLLVEATVPAVESVSITGSAFTGQTGTAIETRMIDDVDIVMTTVTNSAAGVVLSDAKTADLENVTIDTTAGIGIKGSSVETWSMKDVTVDDADLSAIQMIASTTGMFERVTAKRTSAGADPSAGRVFTNGVDTLNVKDVTVSGATSFGLAIAGGVTFSATGLDLQQNGGGLTLRSTAGSIAASTMSKNTLTGVAIEGGDGTITITDSKVDDNGAGGISVDDAGPLQLDGLTIERNGLVGPSPIGGLQFGADPTPSSSTVANTTIRGNGGDVGGGVSVVDSDVSVMLTEVALEANKGPFGDALAVRGGAVGGSGITAVAGTITGHVDVGSEVFASTNGVIDISKTAITGNTGSSIIETASGGDVHLTDVELSGNTASAGLLRSGGGAMQVSGVTATANTAATIVQASDSAVVDIVNSTFSANTIVRALIDATTSAKVAVSYTTFTANTVTDPAGTVLTNDGSATLTVDSSILAGNTAVGWIDAPGVAAPPTVDYSLVPTAAGTAVSGSNNVLTDDPKLGPLQDNGGPKLTHLPNDDSPAVDAANPTPPVAVPTDQRVLVRIVNARADMGSVERQQSPFVVSLPPARVLETRTGPTFTTIDGDFQGIGRRPNGQETTLKIAGRAGVPADAEAVVINVTGVDPDGVGFVTVFPCAVNAPLASSLNFRGDVDSGNELVAELSSDGDICIFNRGVTDLVVDVVGYVPKDSRYSPVGPARLLDTRDTGSTIDGKFQKGGTRLSDTELVLDVAGRGGVSADAVAVVINLTAVKPRDVGYVTVHPCLATEPTAASLNFEPGVNRGNEVVAQLNAEGKLCLYTFGSAELVVDVVGQLTSENTYAPVAPARLYETRIAPNATIDGRQQNTGRMAPGTVVRVEAAGRADVPASAKGVVVNATVVRAANRGFLTVWDCNGTMPLAASLNYTTNETVGNELVVDLNADRQFCVFSSRDTDLTVDVVGYLA